ncbi:hypothetical protein [Marimonas lutisalis]|uniref:hypothetical protein n=1 Tax=Marimonas lutisalis TaxID=2545756 RepID=UPI0010F58C8E|nr:hypothetical protein [Marimonas lutisalis]
MKPGLSQWKLLICVALATAFLLPSPSETLSPFAATAAFAKGGDDGGGDDSGGDDSGGSGSGGSGSGGDDSGGDDSGGDDGDGDYGGGGYGGGGGDDGDGDDGDSDDGDDSSSYSGDDDDGNNSGGVTARDAGNAGSAGRAAQFQSLPNGARLVFPNGSREEIRSGRFQRISPSGRVVEQRAARGSDVARFKAHAKSGRAPKGKSAKPIGSRVVKVVYRGRDVDVFYSNGWRESIRSGSYRMRDAYGRSVVSRPATEEDRKRLGRFRK